MRPDTVERADCRRSKWALRSEQSARGAGVHYCLDALVVVAHNQVEAVVCVVYKATLVS